MRRAPAPAAHTKFWSRKRFPTVYCTHAAIPISQRALSDQQVTSRYLSELLDTGSPLESHLLCQKLRGVQKELGALERCCAVLKRGQSTSILFKRHWKTTNPLAASVHISLAPGQQNESHPNITSKFLMSFLQKESLAKKKST